MNIILNHTLRSIKANVAQPIVIVFTVTVVTMLFFASFALQDLFYNFQLANLSRITGDTDVSITGGIFSEKMLEEFTEERAEQIEYIDEYLVTEGIISRTGEERDQATAVLLESTNLEEFYNRHKDRLTYYKGIEKADYVYPAIWISRSLSEKTGFEIGDETEIYVGLYGRYEKFTVTYIFENEGIFAGSTVYNVLTDVSSFGDKGLYNQAYIKLADGVNKSEFIAELTAHFNDDVLEITDAIDYDYINRVVSDNENLLRIALIFVVALVLFILFSAYTVVAKNRASEMLVFKSAGASPTQLFMILIFEGVFYGIIGGIIGTVCGRFGMEVVVRSVIPSFADAVKYDVWNYLVSLSLGTVISVISSLIPVYRLVTRTVKKQKSNDVKIVKSLSPILLPIPLIFIGGSIAGIILLKEYSAIFTIILIVAVACMIVFIAPYIMKFVSWVFGKASGAVKLASVSVKRNAEAVSLTCMLGAIMAFAFVTISIVGIIIDASVPANTRFNADYVVQAVVSYPNMDEIDGIVEKSHGVEISALLRYDEFEMNVDGKDVKYKVYAVNDVKDLEMAVELTDNEKEIFNNEEKSAVVSYDMLNRMGKSVGDKITLRLNGNDYEFTVIAQDDKVTANDRVVYINALGVDEYFNESIVLVKTNPNVPDNYVYADLREKLEKEGCFILTASDYAYAASVGVDGIALLLRILQVIVGLVGVAGLINMTIAMIMSRKREIGIYRASGLDENKYRVLLLGESAIIGVCGSLIGSAFSVIVNMLVPTFAKLIDRYIAVEFPWTIPVLAIAVIFAYAIIYFVVGARYKLKKVGIEKTAL